VEGKVARAVAAFDVAFCDPESVSYGGRSRRQLRANVPKYEVAVSTADEN